MDYLDRSGLYSSSNYYQQKYYRELIEQQRRDFGVYIPSPDMVKPEKIEKQINKKLLLL